MKLKITMTRGLPGSGKSYWAKSMCTQGFKRVNKDDLRSMVDNGKWSKDNENFILELRDNIIWTSIKEGHSIIVDDTNFCEKHETDLREMAKTLGVDFEIKDFTDVPLDICIARDAQRTNMVGRKVILDMYNKYILPKAKVLEQDMKLPKCIISDIDGTVALHSGRSPYDTDRCDTDLVNESVRFIIKRCQIGTFLFFVSGREEKYREKTERWLNDNGFKNYKLFMRPTGDTRNDAIVKKEIYEDNFSGKYNVLFVLDDRDRVVDTWRSLGLTCLQVNYGSF